MVTVDSDGWAMAVARVLSLFCHRLYLVVLGCGCSMGGNTRFGRLRARAPD
jgi:hypothetical protein